MWAKNCDVYGLFVLGADPTPLTHPLSSPSPPSQLKKVFATVSTAVQGVAQARLEFLGDAADQGGAALVSRLDSTKLGVIDPTKSLLADRTSKVKSVDKEVKVRETRVCSRSKRRKDRNDERCEYHGDLLVASTVLTS